MAETTEVRLTHCRRCGANRYGERQKCSVCGSDDTYRFTNYKCEECERIYQTEDAAAGCCPDVEEPDASLPFADRPFPEGA